MRCSLAKLSFVLASAMLFTHSSTAQNGNWQVLKAVPEGQRVRLSLRGGASREGVLQGVSESAVTIDNGQVLNRDDVRRVWLKGKGKRGKHALIGAGIGAGTGLGMGAAVDGDGSREAFFCTGNYGKAILTPLFGVIGTVLEHCCLHMDGRKCTGPNSG